MTPEHGGGHDARQNARRNGGVTRVMTLEVTLNMMRYVMLDMMRDVTGT
jgi:hypothetical protein